MRLFSILFSCGDGKWDGRGKEVERETRLTHVDPAMWYQGGTIGTARYFSRFIALQILAKMRGTPLLVYDKTP